MLKKIESLREKPKAVRNRYAFGIALVCTGVIALVWATTLPSRLVTQEDPELVASAQEDVSYFSKAFSEVFSRAGEVVNTIRAQRYEKTDSAPQTIDLAALVASSSATSAPAVIATTTSTTSATTTPGAPATTSASTTENGE
jgi:cytoskeletal protein RodZ